MAKIKIQFLKNFAGKKKGDSMVVDTMLFANLRAQKVAKKYKRKSK